MQLFYCDLNRAALLSAGLVSLLLAACSPSEGDRKKDLTDASVCSGAECTDASICEGDECRSETCGDGIVDPGEECDDGNLVAGDGCELDCTFSCHEDADCEDDNPCTVGERCVELPSGRRCQAGTPIQCPPEDYNRCLLYTCDPNAPEQNYCPSTGFTSCYPDEDRDGYPVFDEARRADTAGADCTCPEIDGVYYAPPRPDGLWDCDDGNDRHYPGAPACFRDADGDGFPDINSVDTMRADCTCADGYLTRREDGRWDCDDGDPRLFPGAICFFDNDGDGYPGEQESDPMNSSCACPAGAMRPRDDGLVDCDEISPDHYPGAPCYADEDGDGYLGSEIRGAMDNACDCPSNLMPPDTSRALDCDDSNDEVRPGQTSYFAAPYCRGLGQETSCDASLKSFDYNCNGVEETDRSIWNGSCPMLLGQCSISELWYGSPSACGTSSATVLCDNHCNISYGSRPVRCN